MALILKPILALIFVVSITAANITEIDQLLIGEKLNGAIELLVNNYNYLQKNIGSIDTYTQCSFNDACSDQFSFLSQGLIGDINYGNQSVQFNDTTVKFLHGTNRSQAIINEVCFVNSQKTIWESNQEIDRNDSNLTGVMWQYYGGESGTSIFYPRFEWSDPRSDDQGSVGCSNRSADRYDPRTRPWYVSAISAQKNVILLIDLSDKLRDPSGRRFARMKSSAKLLLGTLSYRDFIGIITYTDYSKQYNSLMMRATVDQIALLVQYIDQISGTVNGSRANIGSGLNSAYAMLINSINNDMTSKCNNVFIVLSSGANNVNTMRSVDIVKQYPQLRVTIFASIYRSDTKQGGILDLAEASCQTDGNLLTVNSDQDASSVIFKFNQYMATATYNQFVRWSEPYDDAITGVRTITGALPIYGNNQVLRSSLPVGVVAIDIALESIRDIDSNLTESDILNYLVKEQSCPGLQTTPDFLKQIQSPDTCGQNRAMDLKQDGSVKNRDWMIAGSVIITVFLVVWPYVLLCSSCANNNNYSSDNTGELYAWGYWLSFTMFILGLWALCVLWIHLFPQIIKYEDWIRTDCTVERIDNNPSRCCEITNCHCQEFRGTSCGSLINAQQEGPCGNGYYCCAETSYQCGCITSCSSTKDSTSCSTVCSTCYICVESVNNRKCDVVCGTCWDPVVTSRFSDKNNELSYGYANIHCGLNDVSCLNQYVAANSPIGKSETCYYNPENKNEIVMSVAYSPGILAAFLIPAVAMGIIFICVLIVLIVNCCQQ